MRGEGNPIGTYVQESRGEFRMTGIHVPHARKGCRGPKTGGEAKDL